MPLLIFSPLRALAVRLITVTVTASKGYRFSESNVAMTLSVTDSTGTGGAPTAGGEIIRKREAVNRTGRMGCHPRPRATSTHGS